MLRPWDLEIEINRDSDISIHIQIAQTIIKEIQHGRFPAAMALPGTRELANKLGVNRKTVVQAYEELISQGWLVSENKRGTFVSSRILSVNNNKKPKQQMDYDIQSKMRSESSNTLNKRYESNFVNFSSGLSDARLIPLELLSRAMRHALITTARTNKQSYIEPKGPLILREALLQMLNMSRGLHTEIDNICVMRGSQMGIYLTARVLLRHGDNVIMANLCDQLISDAFKSSGANIHYLTQDENGLDLEKMERLCQTTKIRVVYVTPHYQVPTTISMPMVNRRKLLALAEQYDFLIIEDDLDFEFHFSGKPLLPLASLDKSNRVIYIGTMSKILAPGFRLGFVSAPIDITKHLASEIMIIDRQGNTITELAIAELLHTGEVNRHTLKILKIYEERRSFAIGLLRLELKDYVDFKVPDGGLSIWLNVFTKINMQTLVKDAELEKVRIVVGSHFSDEKKQISGISLGFASLNNEEILLGIKRLKSAFERQASTLIN